MLRSIIQIRPLLKGARRRGKPRRSRAASIRPIESRLTQLMTVWGHGAFGMPSAGPRRVRTRQTARKLMRTTKKSCRYSPNEIDLRPHGHGLSVALKLAQAALGRFEGLLGLITLGFDAGELLAQVTVVIAALLGLGFPLVAAVFHLGKSRLIVCVSRQAPMAPAHGRGRLHWTCSERIERRAVRCTW